MSTVEKRGDRLSRILLDVRKREGLNNEEKEALLDAANEVSWDDAIHIATPWEPRSSLCGNWERNLVTLDAPRPDGWGGCWTCLMAAEWLQNESGRILLDGVEVPTVSRLKEILDAARRVDRIYVGLCHDENDGEFALWKEDDLLGALHGLGTALRI